MTTCCDVINQSIIMTNTHIHTHTHTHTHKHAHLIRGQSHVIWKAVCVGVHAVCDDDDSDEGTELRRGR